MNDLDEVFGLVRVCRRLGLVLKGKRGEPGAVMVTGDRADFPNKLWDVADALEKLRDDEPEQVSMPEAMVEAMLACMAAQGHDTRDVKAISKYFLDGQEPRYNKKALMEMIAKSERKIRGLGGVAPSSRRPTLRKAPSISSAPKISKGPSHDMMLKQ